MRFSPAGALRPPSSTSANSCGTSLGAFVGYPDGCEQDALDSVSPFSFDSFVYSKNKEQEDKDEDAEEA